MTASPTAPLVGRAVRRGDGPAKLKVLHLITHLGFGGAQDNTLLTVERHDRGRFEVHLASGLDHHDWIPRGRAAADAFFTVPELRRAPHPAGDARAFRAVGDHLTRIRYDVVHTHSAKAGTIGRLAARRAGVPVVVHTYHSFGWQAVPDLRGSAWQRARARATRRLYIELERFVAARSDALITVCDLNREEAIALGLAPGTKLETIYSGIDLERYRNPPARDEACRALGLDPARPVVGTVGRLAPQKAPLDFVQAARQVLRDHPATQVVMVGDGPLAGRVREAIADDPRIVVLGYRDDVPAVLAAMDVFAQASLWEGLGRAATEAMILALPVAATAVDGVPELVEHGETGLLSAPHDPGALARNVGWLLDHPDRAAAMGARGRRRVVPSFAAETMVGAIEAVYERLAAEKGVRDSADPPPPAREGRSQGAFTRQRVDH